MSEIAEKAQVSLFLADFAASDAVGKANVIGMGVSGLGFDPSQGVTSRFSVVAEVRIPSKLAPAEASIELALLNDAGEVTSIPGPVGFQPLRIAQVSQFEQPFVQHGYPMTQRDHVEAAARVVLDFGNGIPLAPGGMYTWQLRIDGDDDHLWTYPFIVSGGQPGPVFG